MHKTWKYSPHSYSYLAPYDLLQFPATQRHKSQNQLLLQRKILLTMVSISVLVLIYLTRQISKSEVNSLRVPRDTFDSSETNTSVDHIRILEDAISKKVTVEEADGSGVDDITDVEDTKSENNENEANGKGIQERSVYENELSSEEILELIKPILGTEAFNDSGDHDESEDENENEEYNTDTGVSLESKETSDNLEMQDFPGNKESNEIKEQGEAKPMNKKKTWPKKITIISYPYDESDDNDKTKEDENGNTEITPEAEELENNVDNVEIYLEVEETN